MNVVHTMRFRRNFVPAKGEAVGVNEVNNSFQFFELGKSGFCEEKKMNQKKEVICLIIGLLGAMSGLYGVVLFNQCVLMSLPLGLRMISMIFIYWLIALIPIIIMLVNKDNLVNYGFSKDKIISQIIVGVLIGIAMSIILTLIPHLFGFGEYVDNGKRYKYLWQFIYEFLKFI